MKEKNVVVFKNVDKVYQLLSNDKRRFKKKMKFYALKDVSFQVKKGSIVGILGTNGSGKSTLSNILAGISSPTSGSIHIHGEQSLIAIKAGLNDNLTGFENIKLKGILLGLSKRKIEDITQGVIDFAELGEFLYQPVKTYSSGMKSRLGFSISIALDPDIIIVDEALSVGDKAFATKCMKRMDELRKTGKTIFFISHSIAQMREFCIEGIWIEGGRLKMQGPMDEVADSYEAYVDEIKSKNKKEQKAHKDAIFESRVEK